jgi:DTW domain-containing protein YfiP
LPEASCVCNKIKPIELPFKITLCCHSNEWQRNDNTGQWALLCSQDISRIKWHRKSELIQPQIDIHMITQQPGHYLLYPSDDAQDINILASDISGDIAQLWVIDGTWQEAQKMLRQSPWLKSLPKVKIQAQKDQTLASQFQLRRNQQGLSTMEAITEAIRGHSPSAANALQHNFHRFQNSLLDLLR